MVIFFRNKNIYFTIFLFVLFMIPIFFITNAAIGIPPEGKSPVSNHYPVQTKRNPGTSDYYFPIGWSLFLHDYQKYVPIAEYAKTGVYNLDIIEYDWEDGILSKIQQTPWNTVLGYSRKGITGDSHTIPSSNQFISFLEEVGKNTYKLKALPSVVSIRHASDSETLPWSLPAAIGWIENYTYSNSDLNLRDYDTMYGSMIASVNSSSDALQGLGGWMLADEPYGGDIARVTPEIPVEVSYTGTRPPDTWFWEYPSGTYNDLVTTLGPPYPYTGPDRTNQIRDDLYYRLKYINLQLQNIWDTSNNHPLHCVIRANGNYVSESTHPELNRSARVSHVIHDDHFLWYDMIAPRRAVGDYNEEPDTTWRDMTKLAIDNLVSTSQVPNSLVHWFDGMAHNKGGSKWVIPDEDLRYMVYSAIVHGARGVMFWLLSKSEQEAFAQAEKIAKEIEIMVPYLLTAPSSVFTDAYLTTQQYGTANTDFLIRRHPTITNKALIIIVNQSNYEEPATWIHFPSSWQISGAESIIPGYGWSKTLIDTNGDGKYDKLGIGTSDWWARSFIVTKAN